MLKVTEKFRRFFLTKIRWSSEVRELGAITKRWGVFAMLEIIEEIVVNVSCGTSFSAAAYKVRITRNLTHWKLTTF